MLKTRIITAVLLLFGFSVDLFFASTAVFAIVLALLVAGCAWEWARISGVPNKNAQVACGALIGVFSLIVLCIPFNAIFMQWLLLVGFLFWLMIPALFYLAPRHAAITDCDNALLVLGVFVLLVTAMSMQYLRSFAPQHSSWLLLYALSIVWSMDIGAYFSGRKFGQRKLALSISPGKTWEGVYGGLVATSLLFLLVLLIADWAQGQGWKLLLATLLSAMASVLGDLYESRYKRAANIKDSSQLLPGHGGLLDRLDGVLAAVPVFAFVWAWL